ncbi:uncharacterized protein DFL_004878 [Arthrobotrys flagrans]|uniref:Uncharacterized protein n=1 Tax=Arthrobotrys flagrans TaxID=97331 RepID=A0A437A6G4_ARTFL|nr:hypothetical protein DFL_004878 [Arthrobotrys flagrans]
MTSKIIRLHPTGSAPSPVEGSHESRQLQFSRLCVQILRLKRLDNKYVAHEISMLCAAEVGSQSAFFACF